MKSTFKFFRNPVRICRRQTKGFLVIVVIVAMIGFMFAGCEGPMGPIGPEGEPGIPSPEYELVIGVDVEEVEFTLPLGRYIIITPTVYPADAIIQTLMWELYDADTNVVSLTRVSAASRGLHMLTGNSIVVTGLNDGETEIAVTALGSGGVTIRNTITVTVEGVNTHLAALPDQVDAFGDDEDAKVTITAYATFGMESIPPQTLNFGRPVEITLRGGVPNVELYLYGAAGTMFTVGSEVTLILEDITLRGVTPNTAGPLIVVDNGGKLVMDTGSRITGNNNTDATAAVLGRGGAVRINNGGTFILDGGSIYRNEAFEGGGVCMDPGGTFTMYSGVISHNLARLNGGGVYVRGNADFPTTFTMRGGEISHNRAMSPVAETGNGGGVGGTTFFTFNMHGGIISDNTAFGGGGVHIAGNSSRFNMHDGARISGNTAIGTGAGHGGGGVHLNPGFAGATNYIAFTMHGGEISGNTAVHWGGGVRMVNHNRFFMEGGSIFGNTADTFGGGVFVNTGAAAAPSIFTMRAGVIYGNTANQGGGVRVNTGAGNIFHMLGGVISGNTATGNNNSGGGVDNRSIFLISDGVIYGVDETVVAHRNAASVGAALFGTAQSGTFVNDVFDTPPLGEIETTNFTIEVRNGILLRPSAGQ